MRRRAPARPGRAAAVWAVALLAVAFAGCLERETRTTIIPPLPTPPPPLVAAPVTIDPAGGHARPAMGASDGALFAVGVEAGGAYPVASVYRSADNGSHWQQFATPLRTPDLGPDLAVDADGTVWVSSLWNACADVAVSRDGGRTWVDNPMACGLVPAERHYLAPTSGGEAFLFFQAFPLLQPTVLRTSDHGRTWTPTVPIVAPLDALTGSATTGRGGSAFWDPAGDAVWVTFAWMEGGIVGGTGPAPAMHPGYAWSQDGGASWTVGRATVDDLGQAVDQGIVTGAADEAGNVYIAWAAGTAGSAKVYVAGSDDGGASWTGPLRVDAGDAAKVSPRLAAGGEGRIAVVYYEADRPAVPHQASADTGWNVTVAWVEDFFGVPAVQRQEMSQGAVHRGRICDRGSFCGVPNGMEGQLDAVGLDDGRLGAVWTATVGTTRLVEVFAQTQRPILADG